MLILDHGMIQEKVEGIDIYAQTFLIIIIVCVLFPKHIFLVALVVEKCFPFRWSKEDIQDSILLDG